MSFPLSATPAAGTRNNAIITLGNQYMMSFYGENDGSTTNAQNPEVRIYQPLRTESSQKGNTTQVDAATYDLAVGDYILAVDYTSTGAVTSLTLPTAQCDGAEDEGREIIIKDTGGNSNTNNITVDTEGSETIDGAATLTLNQDYESYSLFCYSSDWYIY
jgi:hypothetical protein